VKDSISEGMSSQELAERSTDAMWSQDRASAMLGMRITRVGQGHSEVKMLVRDDMINGHNMIHGGLVFSLADSAFALACNSRNKASFAMSCNINFIRPAMLGDELTAIAKEKSVTRSSGYYEVTVTNQDSKVIAHFGGRSFTHGDPLIGLNEGQ
jgi:acyl-CoA thioesterase